MLPPCAERRDASARNGSMVVLTLQAKHDYLQKVASIRDPVKALAEFVWNAVDADATKVSVDLVRNALGGLESFLIRDNGTGISRERAEHDFESLGESWKLHTLVRLFSPTRFTARRA